MFNRHSLSLCISVDLNFSWTKFFQIFCRLNSCFKHFPSAWCTSSLWHLTPAVWMEYLYFAIFISLLKKKYLRYWLQVCTIRLLHVCSFSESVYLPASHVIAYAGLLRGNGCATSCFDVWLNACLCFITADPWHQTHHYTLLSQHASLKYQWGLTSQLMFCTSQATWKIPNRVLVQKILHKKCLSELIK